MARRKPTDAAALDPALTQKKRARRRLVGALVLGTAAAITLPLVLDSEPRQPITDVEIEIPPREAPLPTADLPRAPDAVPPVAADNADEVAAAAQPPAARPAPEDDTRLADPSSSPPVAATQPAADARTEARIDAKKPAPAKAAAAAHPPAAAAEKPADVARAATNGAFAVQVGAFANAGSARAQIDKVRRSGQRAYTEKVQTAKGERTRVRVGPFATRDAAESARASLKAAGIESVVVDAR